MNQTPLYIFDLDGTLALTEHRQHLVKLSPGSKITVAGEKAVYAGPSLDQLGRCNIWLDDESQTVCLLSEIEFKPDWPAFFKACVYDLPNMPVIGTLGCLLLAGAEVWIFSGRSDEVYAETVEWLQKNVQAPLPDGAEISLKLMMRPAGDFTPDEGLKKSWLYAMEDEDYQRLIAVFDDRDKVVAMWREEGIPCFQVAPGAF